MTAISGERVISWDEAYNIIKPIAIAGLPRNDPAITEDDLIQEALFILAHEESRKRGGKDGWSGPLSHLKTGADWAIRNAIKRTSIKRNDAKNAKRSDGGVSLDGLPNPEHLFSDGKSLEEWVIQRENLLKVLKGTVLTPEQARVIWPELIGYSEREISEKLGISTRQVVKHTTEGRKSIAYHYLELSESHICPNCQHGMYRSKRDFRCIHCGYRQIIKYR